MALHQNVYLFNVGICPRSIEKIFQFLETNAEMDYEVQLRYVEAYNDKV